MHTRTKKKFSVLEREAQVVATVMLKTFLALAPSYYGARHLGAAMEKILIVAAVRVAEASSKSCTISTLTKVLRMPRTSVQRALAQLETVGAVTRTGRTYHAAALSPERVDKAGRDAVLNAIIAAGHELEALAAQAAAAQS
jgi:hypothetical protein